MTPSPSRLHSTTQLCTTSCTHSRREKSISAACTRRNSFASITPSPSRSYLSKPSALPYRAIHSSREIFPSPSGAQHSVARRLAVPGYSRVPVSMVSTIRSNATSPALPANAALYYAICLLHKFAASAFTNICGIRRRRSRRFHLGRIHQTRSRSHVLLSTPPWTSCQDQSGMNDARNDLVILPSPSASSFRSSCSVLRMREYSSASTLPSPFKS